MAPVVLAEAGPQLEVGSRHHALVDAEAGQQVVVLLDVRLNLAKGLKTSRCTVHAYCALHVTDPATTEMSINHSREELIFRSFSRRTEIFPTVQKTGRCSDVSEEGAWSFFYGEERD